VREVLARPFPLGDSELFATSSIGLALSAGPTGGPDPERSPETLLEQADAAMYRAKEKGGNRFELFDAGMRDRALHRLELQSALHRGLERHEFRVHYQPTVDLRTGVVVGVEALARWDRHEHGLVLPAEFIALAEEDGLIIEIGAQVLEQAFRQAGHWHDAADQPVGPSVNVNLSTRQLVDPGLVGRVRQALERASVDPGCIALEITESALISDVATSTATLDALKRLGVRLYVDDFGTGYSSLAYLQHFPVDGVKVDRSFVADLGRTPDAEAIVRAVIGLAGTMGLVPIAEGVETASQVRWLRDLGCDVAQGFYLGRPVPAERVQLGPRAVHASGTVTLPA
jgi:EAL domain-containing protein (putative c-di-GMP-specific phosphodiesterase class I)